MSASARRNYRLSQFRGDLGHAGRPVCFNCGHPGRTCHPRRIGGGGIRMVCNACTRERRRAARQGREAKRYEATPHPVRRNGTGRPA